MERKMRLDKCAPQSQQLRCVTRSLLDFPIKCKILISEESPYFFHYLCKISGQSDDSSELLKIVYTTFSGNLSNSLLFRSYLLNVASLWSDILYSRSGKYGLSSHTKIWVELHQDFEIERKFSGSRSQTNCMRPWLSKIRTTDAIQLKLWNSTVLMMSFHVE